MDMLSQQITEITRHLQEDGREVYVSSSGRTYNAWSDRDREEFCYWIDDTHLQQFKDRRNEICNYEIYSTDDMWRDTANSMGLIDIEIALLYHAKLRGLNSTFVPHLFKRYVDSLIEKAFLDEA